MAKLLKSTEKSLSYSTIAYLGIGFLLFFIPLYPKFPLFSVSGTYVSIRFEDILVAGLVGIFGLQRLLKNDLFLFRKKITQLIALYLGIGLLSILSGIFITKNITPHLAFLHWLRRVEYISLLFVGYYSFKNIKQLKFFGWSILISTFGVIVYGLGQKFFGWPVVSTMNKEFSKGLILRLTWWARVNSTFAGHYDLAAYLVLILCLTAAALVMVKKWKVRILVFFLGLFSYYMLLLTSSRISFGAYLVGVLFVLVMSKKWFWLPPFIVFSLLGMIFAGDLGQRYAATFKIDLSFLSVNIKPPSTMVLAPTLTPTLTPIPKPYIGPTKGPSRPGMPLPTPTPTQVPVATASAELFEPMALAVGRSTDIRLKVEWPRAINAFLKNPLLGTGYSSITLATDNDYLRMLGETGILGFFAFFAFMIAIGEKFWLCLKGKVAPKEDKLLVLGIVGASIGYFLNAAFIDVLEASKIAFFFWILMGIGLKIVDLSQLKTEREG